MVEVRYTFEDEKIAEICAIEHFNGSVPFFPINLKDYLLDSSSFRREEVESSVYTGQDRRVFVFFSRDKSYEGASLVNQEPYFRI